MVSDSIVRWTPEPPSPEVRAALRKLARDEDVHRVAVMPDVHLAGEVCVGVAVATKSTLIPAGVGGDIGCGMAAMAFDVGADLLARAPPAARLLEGLGTVVPIMRHARRVGLKLPQALRDTPLSQPGLEATKVREGPLQLGTLGRGNHFVEFQADEDEQLWVMVHTGSRGLGQAIRTAHEREGRRNRSGLQVLDAHSPAGAAYLNDVEWALAYADRSRMEILDRIGALMRDTFGVLPLEVTRIACHHNFVRAEQHDDQRLWVHRKGAISALPGEPGIIPGSMGAPSFHVEGRGCTSALCSSSHGAGRVVSRGAARQRITKARFEASMEGVWYDHRRSRRLLDEAPDAYKDIHAVMRAQKELTKPTRTLRPVLSFKGA